MIHTRGWALRKLLRYAPWLGVVPHPGRRPPGLTAVVRVKNEEDWIDVSLRSVADVVDELVVVDNGSTDRTPDILADLRRALGPKLRRFARPDLDHVDLSNFALDQVAYRWALKWDGDFVARTTGPHAIRGLRERLLALPAHRHVHVRLTAVELMGDLWHQCPGYELRREPFASVVSPSLRFTRVVRAFDTAPPGWPRILRPAGTPYVIHFEDVRVPLYYDVAQWDEPYFFHLQVKSPLRMYLRDCWSDWLENPDLQRRFAGLEDYALARARRAWNVATLHDAAETYMARLRELLIPYSIERFGEHPAMLEPYLARVGRT
jgi:glycosyltransferase involved in cell wall biosynthesis